MKSQMKNRVMKKRNKLKESLAVNEINQFHVAGF